jgi:hypothetical protein
MCIQALYDQHLTKIFWGVELHEPLILFPIDFGLKTFCNFGITVYKLELNK